MASVSKRQWTHKGVRKEAWTVRYFDEKGVRRSKGFEQKKTADAFKKKMEREIDDGIHVALADSRTVNDAAIEFLKHSEDMRRDGQIGGYHYATMESNCRTRIVPAIGNIVLRDLRLEQVAAFNRGMRNDGLKPASARKVLSTLRRIEVFARKREWLKTQPVADAIAELRRVPSEKIATFTPDEVARLLQFSGERRWQCNARTTAYMHLMIHLAALCGLRMGEIIGLPIDAIDFDKRRIVVRQSWSRFDGAKETKTPAGMRVVPLPTRVAPLLRDWIETHHIPNDDGLLLTGPRGNALHSPPVRERWHSILKAAGMAGRHFHALRHFHASWLIMHGMPAPEVAKLLGHSQFDMTLRVYTHALLDDESKFDRADKIAGLLAVADATAPQQPVSA